MESNENAPSRGDADDAGGSPRKKRRRTVLGTADTELTPHTLRDPYVQRLFSEHTHGYEPPLSPEAAWTKAPSESDYFATCEEMHDISHARLRFGC